MTDAENVPTIRALSADEAAALEEGLDFAGRIAGAARPLTIATVQRLYDGYLDEGIADNDAIIALGLAFGDDVARHGGLVWVRVIDDIGEETCIAPPHRMAFAAPVSMIRKRLGRAEKVDLAALRAATLDTISEQMRTASPR